MWIALAISLIVSLDCADQASAVTGMGRKEETGTTLSLSQSGTSGPSAISTHDPETCGYCQGPGHDVNRCWYCQSSGRAVDKDRCCMPPASSDALITAVPSDQSSVSPVSNTPMSWSLTSPNRSSLDVLLGGSFAAEVFGSPGTGPKQPAPLLQETTHSACSVPDSMPKGSAEAAPCALPLARNEIGDQGKPCSQKAGGISTQGDAVGGSSKEHALDCPADMVPLLPLKNAVVPMEGKPTHAQYSETSTSLSASTAHQLGPSPNSTLLNPKYPPGWQLLKAPCAQAPPFQHLSADTAGHGQDTDEGAVESNYGSLSMPAREGARVVEALADGHQEARVADSTDSLSIQANLAGDSLARPSIGRALIESGSAIGEAETHADDNPALPVGFRPLFI